MVNQGPKRKGYGSRPIACLLMGLAFFTQRLESYTQEPEPGIFVPRFEFRCSNQMPLERCSTDDLSQNGWRREPDAEAELSSFTSLVLAYAHVGEIQGAHNIALKVKERKLYDDWKTKQHGNEALRPWIIEVDIERSESSYSITVYARRVHDDNELYTEVITTAGGKFSDVVHRACAKGGESLKRVGNNILAHSRKKHEE
jgi:hypothetical protein